MQRPAEPVRELMPPAILLIEDEPGIVDFVRRGMEAEGFQRARPSSTASRASGARCSEGFDAVVLDLMLPGRDGLEVLAVAARGQARRCR